MSETQTQIWDPAVLASEGLFEGILEAAPDAVVIVDRQGIIRIVNDQTEKLFGYPRAELLGKNVDELVPESVRSTHKSHRDRYLKDARTRPMGMGLDLHARRKDGTEIPVEISLSPLHKADGNILVIATIRDVTERHEWEQALARRSEELEQSNAELQQFAYVASHDLQEPLRMIVSFLGLLKKRYGGQLDAEADEFINFAVDGGTRMQALIQDLLTYSRVGGRDLAPELVDTGKLVDDVLTELRPTIEEKRARVTRGRLPKVKADPIQISRVFQNLIANGLKFHGEEAPRISIEAELIGSAWMFSVKDNGIGIPPEQFDRIFRIFQRLHSQAEYPGTGIGLAICKRIIERHGGRIWVNSTPGEGTTFHFTVPDGED
jgi:PAS domain S-box-containing protein